MDASQIGKLEIRVRLDMGLKIRAEWYTIVK